MTCVQAIDEGLDASWPAKARHLAEAVKAGLRVPAAWVWRSDSPPTPSELRALVDAACGEGELIARSALAGEDEADHSAAGLGLSVGGLRDYQGVVAALRQLDEARDAPQLCAYREGLGLGRTDDTVILQRFVQARAVIVGAVLPSLDYIEVHADGSALGSGTSPLFAGALQRWPDPAGPALAMLFTGVRQAFDRAAFGLDVEVAIDDADVAHLVQVRPLTADILADGRAFVAQAREAGEDEKLDADLILDGEHNPEVLSVAHGSLIDWIGRKVPGAGRPRTILGWLYTERLVRDLRGTATGSVLSPAEALAELENVLLPRARARLVAVEGDLAHATLTSAQTLLDRALAAVAEMLGGYLGVLVPARAAAKREIAGRPSAPFGAPFGAPLSTPLSTRGRHAFVDVLPASWDIASPTLGSLHNFAPATEPDFAPATEPATRAGALPPAQAAVLLGEWDDHLFALGLAPLRRVFLRVAALLRLRAAEVFALTLDELRAAVGPTPANTPRRAELAERIETRAAWNRLRPPARLDWGVALPWLPRDRLRGLPLGPTFRGVIAQRDGLEALLRDPPPPTAIVVLPALTAQAALALRELGLRAVVCAYGGALSHAALMVRELCLSALVGCQGCTEVPDGTDAELDTRTGRLRLRSRLR